MTNRKVSIGILAHVDAGKTSLTEQLLYVSGATKILGSVDEGTASTDRLSVEKQRGISVQSAYTSIDWKDTEIFLIDTPGHVDFSSEVERILSVIDIAVLVISAVEGVQAHTETLWNVLHNAGIPIVIFINKIDRVGSDCELVIRDIRKEFEHNYIILNEIVNEGSADVSTNHLLGEHINNNTLEALANLDDTLLEKYLAEEPIERSLIVGHLQKALRNNKIYPILSGSAKMGLSVDLLLDMVDMYGMDASKNQNELSARIFGVENIPGQGNVAHIKVFTGSLSPRDLIKNSTQNIEEKINQIKKNRGADMVNLQKAEAGDVVNVLGLKEAHIGDWLGEMRVENNVDNRLQTPLLTVQVKPVFDKDYISLAEALEILNLENPELKFEWLRDDKELHLQIMGQIQMEVLTMVLRDRFGIEAVFENPTVIYKETPASQGIGFAEYTMPKPCWAVVKFKIEPGIQGSGVIYSSKVSVDKIQKKYQNEIENEIYNALKQGIKGWEITDLKITLIGGEDHEMHSRPGDFIIATHMAIMQGLSETDTILLEPILTFKITASEELLGSVAGDITQMRGTINSPHIENEKFTLTGLLPLATSLEYAIQLSSRSGGKAKISTRLHSFHPCSDEQGSIRPYKGVSPLDRSKYILKMRKALQ